jgi:hypothetical protein
VIIAATGIFQITDWFSQGYVYVEEWPLGVSESKTLSLQVTNAAKPLNMLLITYPDTMLDIALLDTDNKKILTLSYSRMSKDIKATVSGTYKLLMTNNGSSPTLVTAALCQPELAAVEEIESKLDSMSGTLGSGALIVITAFIIMNAGATLAFNDRKKNAGLPVSSLQS